MRKTNGKGMKKMRYPKNTDIAHALTRIAELLEVQGANPFRVNAYRRAARRINEQEQDVAVRVLSREDDFLEDLPDIGQRIAGVVREFVHSGRIGLLDNLEGQIEPERIFMTVPNIGKKLAKRIHHELDIDTLADLEIKAHAGLLQQVKGIGATKEEAIRDSVGAMLNRFTRQRTFVDRGASKDNPKASIRMSTEKPSVEAILSVDAEYRRRARKGELKRIAPRRFNPDASAWLPIMHTERDGWEFTANYSNTARAHELNRTGDWVVIYGYRDGEETQHTVVTEQRGVLAGRRVVRGRESECRRSLKETFS
jgi:hypothetical protein